MLQARIFSYADAHRYRLGTHYEALPINAPKCPMNHYHKDGKMRFFPNFPNPDVYYEPNSFNGPVESPDFSEPPLKISGDADRYNPREGNDDYGQKAHFSQTSPKRCRACRLRLSNANWDITRKCIRFF